MVVNNWRGLRGLGTDQFEPIDIRLLLHKLVDIPVVHPLRHHCELGLRHYHTHERQHVWMSEGLPRHELLAELLHDQPSVSRRLA